jgi:hypothetical protein
MNDTVGNMGATENVNFTVAKPEPESFPVVPVIAVSVVAVALVAAGLLVYHKKHNKNSVVERQDVKQLVSVPLLEHNVP